MNNQSVIWGENNYYSTTHIALKEAHGGINVFVSVDTPTSVPLPGTLALVLGGMMIRNRSRKP